MRHLSSHTHAAHATWAALAITHMLLCRNAALARLCAVRRWQHDTDTTRFDEIWSNACACHVHVRAVKVELEHHCLLATRSPTHVTSSPQHRSGRTAASLDARAVCPPPWAMRVSRRPPTALGLRCRHHRPAFGRQQPPQQAHVAHGSRPRVVLRSVRGTTSVLRVSHLCPGLTFHRPDTHLVRLALRALRDALHPHAVVRYVS